MPTTSVNDQQDALNAVMARIQTIRTHVERARIEKGVAQAQIAELKPRREALRAESQEKYGVSVAELPERIEAKMGDLEARVSALESQYETLSAPAAAGAAGLVPMEDV